MKLLLLSPLLFIAILASGQAEQLSPKQIDSIVLSIDSMKELRTAILDGTLKPKGKRKPTGGFSDTYLIVPAIYQLVKVQRGQSPYYTEFTTYYFYKDSLIFVSATMYNLTDDKEVSTGQYYFQKGLVMERREQHIPLNRPELFLEHGRRYLADVKTIFNL